MADGSYRGGGTIGGKWGCALSALVGLPLLAGALLIASMGDCAPGANCIADWKLFGAAITIATVVGIGSRATINALVRRWRDHS